MYLANIDEKIDLAISSANKKQCQNCKAMIHANDVEREKHEREIFKRYKAQLAATSTSIMPERSWSDVLKDVMSAPYIYIVGCILAMSPYGVEIIK